MRTLYIFTLVISAIFAFFTLVMSSLTNAAKLSNFIYESYLDRRFVQYTLVAGSVSGIYFVFTFILYVATLIKLPTKTMKILSVFGLCFSAAILAWDALMISRPGHISFEEVAPAWFVYVLIPISISIVGIVQANRYKRKQHQVFFKP